MSCSKPVTPGLRPGYDVAATKTIWNRREIVGRTYDWSQRACVLARGKSVATRSMVMFKTCNLRFQIGSLVVEELNLEKIPTQSCLMSFDCQSHLFSFTVTSGVMISRPCRTSYQSSPSSAIPCFPRDSLCAYRRPFCDVTAV